MKKKKIEIILLSCLLLIVSISGCTEFFNNEKEGYWNWDLKTGKTNNITFTKQQINCAESDKIEDVFSSINTEEIDLWIFYVDPNERTISWYRNRDHNELTTIYSGRTYSVFVKKDCTLKIKIC